MICIEIPSLKNFMTNKSLSFNQPSEPTEIINNLRVTIYYPTTWGIARVNHDIDQNRWRLLHRKRVRLDNRQWSLEAEMGYRRKLPFKTRQSLLTMLASGALINPQFV